MITLCCFGLFFLHLNMQKPADYGSRESCFYCKKNTKFDQETDSLLIVKTKSGAHKRQT